MAFPHILSVRPAGAVDNAAELFGQEAAECFASAALGSRIRGNPAVPSRCRGCRRQVACPVDVEHADDDAFREVFASDRCKCPADSYQRMKESVSVEQIDDRISFRCILLIAGGKVYPVVPFLV